MQHHPALFLGQHRAVNKESPPPLIDINVSLGIFLGAIIMSTINRKLLSGTSLVALATAFTGTAFAADLATKAPRMLAPEPMMTWTGFYLGLNAGAAWNNASATWGFNGNGGGAGPGSAPLSQSLGTVGIQGGYNYQVNQMLVIGAEGDISGAPFSTVRKGFNATKGSVDGQMTGLASLRGRVGLAFDRTLVYVTGGVGWVHGNYAENSKKVSGSFFDSTSTAGVVGGGVEYKVTPKVTIGAEYLAYLNSGTVQTVNSTGRTYKFGSGNVSTARARVSYTW
jgi:outer membrane immunogenic protein